jgi:outer membrane protein TolC
MRRTRALAALVGAALLSASPTAAAQEGGVSLGDVLGLLFHPSPAFQLLAAQTRGAAGSALRTSGTFDVVATTTLLGQRNLYSSSTGPLTNDGYQDLLLQAGVGVRTRANVSIQLNGSLPLISSIDSATSIDQPQVGATLTIPLLKLGPSAAFGADERAARLHASASVALQADAESELAAGVAAAYWSWAGSVEQLQWARRLEALARDQLRDVELLIAQHARAAADRLPFAAAADGATATRLAAEQAMFAQQQLVWQALGLAPPGAAMHPASTLPEVPPVDDTDALARRAHALAARRPLWRALDDELRAAEVRTRGAEIGKRPDLNLVAQATALRVTGGGGVLTSASSTMSSGASGGAAADRLGYYGSVALQFALPIPNRAARGAWQEARAAEDAAALSRDLRRNGVEGRIDTLVRTLRALSATYRERASAAAKLQASYEAQRTRFRLGTATAMDVVVAEQQYMSASLATVADRVAWAVSVARFEHESGALGDAVRARDAAAAAGALVNSTF